MGGKFRTTHQFMSSIRIYPLRKYPHTLECTSIERTLQRCRLVTVITKNDDIQLCAPIDSYVYYFNADGQRKESLWEAYATCGFLSRVSDSFININVTTQRFLLHHNVSDL